MGFGDNSVFSLTMRPCPVCKGGRKLNTNRRGVFVCPACHYTDRKDVAKLRAAGLDYTDIVRAGWHEYRDSPRERDD